MPRKYQLKLKPAGFTISDSARGIVEEKAKAAGTNFSQYVRESIEMRMRNEDIAEQLKVSVSEMIEASMLQIASDNRAAYEMLQQEYANVGRAFSEIMKEMDILKHGPAAVAKTIESQLNARFGDFNLRFAKMQEAFTALANKNKG